MTPKEKATEEYYRVDFETAKLLKDAECNLEVCALYESHNLFFDQSKVNYNDKGLLAVYSAPLISAALEWANQKGYFRENITVFKIYQRTPIASIDLDKENPRQYDLDYIKACCIDIINNK